MSSNSQHRGARFDGPILGLLSVRIAFALATALGLLFVFLSPLTGVAGPESAVVLGIVMPPFVAAAGARLAISARPTGVLRAGELLERGVWVAAGATLIPLSILAINGLRVPWCAPVEGLAFVLLGPALGNLLAAMVGLCIGVSVIGRRRATALAALVPLFSLALSASLLVSTPAIYSFGHFFGFFPGTLYDPDITIEPRYLTFRALTAAQIGGLVAFFLAAVEPSTARISRRHARGSIGSMGIALAFFAAALLGDARATSLDHRSTARSIEERLGARVRGAHCDVVVPRELPRKRAERLRDDCDFRVEQTSETLGLSPNIHVTAFFFRSAEEKRTLMGASHTYIAKPWRREVYLQLDRWPHPVLAHEIVHAVAGMTGIGPFRISGTLGGFLPSPGIIEGVAVAVAWEEREGLTPHQWARAMMELEWTPSISATEGLGFLLQPASRAYVTSGSFVRWILETRGNSAVRAIYRAGDYRSVLGDLEQAEREWRDFLMRDVVLPPEALAMARMRFERPAIFAQVCPHRVAALMGEVQDDMSAGDETHAARACEQILDIDPGDTSARAWLAVASARLGDLDRARRELSELVGPPSASRPVIRAARLGIADALWARGDVSEAGRGYREILAEPTSDEDARQIEVRLLAIEGGLASSKHVRELFAPPQDETHDLVTMMSAVGHVRDQRTDGLGSYLEARQLLLRERFDLAGPVIEDMNARGLPSARLLREARRMTAQVEFGLGRIEQARRIWEEVAHDPTTTEGAHVEARDWIARIRWAGQRLLRNTSDAQPTPATD